ncbi:S26 family signal peptidase [Planosporangium thailandense]|uniref:S26 family signal peptidase n=1 Tax=Planosporangium thailandense TaxID=765197 RepID=A0ABX0Y0P6_9ACTN|nr:S24/S26 family peptidase [Planosporangium thailandense]NJC71155.1 S26 family signal peptidase [Planosporangium thailandense]
MLRLRLANQRVMARVAARLADGHDDWFTALGTSMSPAIKVVQRVDLRPVGRGERLLGQIVLTRVTGRFWLHRVVDEEPERVRIAGDNGFVNGWTARGEVYGVLLPSDRPPDTPCAGALHSRA